MTGPDENQEQALRRLLAEAVAPLEPGPGAEARLQARIRARKDERREAAQRRTRVLGWGATALGSTAAVVVAVVLLVNGAGRSGSDSSSSSAGGANSAPSAVAPRAGGSSSSEADTSQVPAAGSAAGTPSPALSATAMIPQTAASPSTPLLFSATPTPTLRLPGIPGAPSVQLPAIGRPGGIRAVVQLPTLAGGTVTVAVVRFTAATGPVDVLVSVVDGRLTVLQLGGRPLQLRVDATHGYGCSTLNGLAIAGQNAPYVVDGASLVRSPFLVGVMARAGRAACPG